MNQGIITHRVLRVFEELSAGFQARGASKRYADYYAMVAAFVVEGYPRKEAEQFARKHLPYPPIEEPNERPEAN